MLNKILLALIFSTYLFSGTLGEVLYRLKAKNENRIVKKDNIEIVYFDKEHKHISSKKIYDKNKNLLQFVEYLYSPYQKRHEYIFTYDKTDTKRKRHKFTTKTEKYYFDNGRLSSDIKRKVVNRRYVTIYSKKYFQNGKLKSNFEQKDNDSSLTFEYYKNGVIHYKIFVKNSNKNFKEYNRLGRLEKDENYNISYDNEVKDGWQTYFNYYGVFKREAFYKGGNYEYASTCTFSIRYYLSDLRKKYSNVIDYRLRKNDVICKKIANNKSLIIQAFQDDEGRTSLLLATVNRKKNKILDSIYDKNTKIYTNNYIEILKKSYTSLTRKNTYDIVGYTQYRSEEGGWTSEASLETYKIKKDKIIKIKKSKLNLKKIEENVKNGQKFTSKIIESMLFEKPLNKSNLVRYNNIAYYLQKNKQYKESTTILINIVAQFPNRVVALLNYADSLWALNEKKQAIQYYNSYIRIMLKKDRLDKIPKKVFLRIE